MTPRAEAGGRLAVSRFPGAPWAPPPLSATSPRHTRPVFHARQGPVSWERPAAHSLSAGSSRERGAIGKKSTCSLHTIKTPVFSGLKDKSDWALTKCPRLWREPASLCRPTALLRVTESEGEVKLSARRRTQSGGLEQETQSPRPSSAPAVRGSARGMACNP